MDFVGNAFAPNALLIKEDLARLNAARQARGDRALLYRFPDRQARDRQARDRLANPLDPGETELRAGMGFGPWLDPAARPLALGEAPGLAQASPAARSALYESADMFAPEPLAPYCASPFVLLVNRAALEAAGAPVPRSWEDLLDERYRGLLVCTPEPWASNVSFVGTYSLFGASGLEAFARNLCCTASASVIPTLASHPRPGKGAVFAVPWFFARCCPPRPEVETVWPAEGALALPLGLALRDDADEAAREVAGYFLGESFARQSARLCLPCAHAASDGELPDPACKLYWPGEPFLRGLDVGAYTSLAERLGEGVKGVDEP